MKGILALVTFYAALPALLDGAAFAVIIIGGFGYVAASFL